MASAQNPVPPVTRLANSAAPDAGSTTIVQYKQAVYISMWLVGPKGQEFVPGLTRLEMTESYEGAEFKYTSATLRGERTMGNRKFTGSFTRYQPRLRPLKALIARCYGIDLSTPKDIRLDIRPLTVYVQYELLGPDLDPTQTALDTELVTYAEVYFNNVKNGYIDDLNSFSTEEADMECQNEMISGVGNGQTLTLMTAPFSQSYPAQSGKGAVLR